MSDPLKETLTRKKMKSYLAALNEESLSSRVHDESSRHAQEIALPGAKSISDESITIFSRGELPHYAGITTLLKTKYLEDVSEIGNYDMAYLGIPFDMGTTYRAGTRFGPQGMRRISALYTPCFYELGVDLVEQVKM